jgi:hypothetical protein
MSDEKQPPHTNTPKRRKAKPERHLAEQFGLPVTLAVTVKLTNHSADAWFMYQRANAHLSPSNAQLVKGLVERALNVWLVESKIQEANK